MTIYGLTDGSPECECHRCLDERRLSTAKMILCGECGNKRCPEASDHRLACTHSNEPGQVGSVYGPKREMAGS